MQFFSNEYLANYGFSDDYLIHYGVPGMKWGHRKGSYSVGGLYNRARARGDARNDKRWNTELARDSAKAASRAKIAKQLNSKGHKKLASAFSKSSKIHKDWTKSDRIMADMYKKSKQSRLKKADAADKAKADKKAQKQAKLDAMTPEQKKAYIRKQRLKRAAIGVGVAAGVAGAAYGYHKLSKKYGTKDPRDIAATIKTQRAANKQVKDVIFKNGVQNTRVRSMKNNGVGYEYGYRAGKVMSTKAEKKAGYKAYKKAVNSINARPGHGGIGQFRDEYGLHTFAEHAVFGDGKPVRRNIKAPKRRR